MASPPAKRSHLDDGRATSQDPAGRPAGQKPPLADEPAVTPLYLRPSKTAPTVTRSTPAMAKGPGSPMADSLLRSIALVKRLQGLEKVRRSFINEAAHELNTPLTPLRIHVDALRTRKDLDREARRHLEVIDRNLLRLSRVVEAILELARLESRRFHLDLAELPLAEAVGQVVQGLSKAAKQAGVELVLAPGAPVYADGDQPHVAKVVETLITNALQFTPSGGKVTAAVTAIGGEAVVSVADTGLGLSPEQLSDLFQPFSRPHEVPGMERGPGLALFIAKGLVERQGGRIWAESPGLGKGATFSFSLPLSQPATASTSS